MSKLKLTDTSGNILVTKAPVIKGCKAVGSQVLVELLTAQEILGTNLHIDEGVKAGAPQGYVIGLGPKVIDDWGFKVGDRVVLSGNFTPLPEINAGDRLLACVEPHTIKAVLVEHKCCGGGKCDTNSLGPS